MQTTFIVHVEDQPGVLTRVTSLIRRRGFNIESLTVGRTERRGVSRMTIVMDVDAIAVARIEAHLYKLVHVRARVVDVSPDSLVIEITGTEEKIDGLVEMLKPYGVLEMARTGRVAMSRGAGAPVAAAIPAAVDDELALDSGISCSV
jgi:acetolactate synthase-1/3 small subunit